VTAAFAMFEALALPEHLAGPYPLYAWLQEHDPAHRDPDGTVYLSRHRDAVLLREPSLREVPTATNASTTLRTLDAALIKAVPPRHTQLRRLGAAAFDRSLLHRAQPAFERLADQLVGDLGVLLERDGVADLHTAYALPFTQGCAAEVFGIPDCDVEGLSALPARMFGALYPHHTAPQVADADDASATLRTYMEGAVRKHAFVPGSGFAALTAAVGTGPEDASYDDVVGLCWMLWWASYTSALAAVDLAALTLVEHPESVPVLLSRTREWVDEALRYRSPHVINSANLRTTRTTTLADLTVPAGTPVRFLLGAMNRDPGVFRGPHRFTPGRRGSRHVEFGEGIHTCIGAQLARREVAVALTTLARQLPRLALAEQPAWRPYTTQRLCSRLLVTAA
jgi:cytochrome P450